jgi:DNA-binding NarL/FixJ family response regulator
MSINEPDITRILIVDDHPMFRFGIRGLFGTIPALRVVGEAGSGGEAVALAQELQPDVVLMDIAMPDMDGIQATVQVLGQAPKTHVLILSMFDDDESVFAAMRVGARGYVLKGAGQEEMVRAIKSVSSGEMWLSPAIANKVLGYFARGPRKTLAESFPELSQREIEVLNLMVKGADNAAIAQALFLTPKSVRNYVWTIVSKLHAANRAEVIDRVRKSGIDS